MSGCGYGQPDINNGGTGTAGVRSVTVIFAYHRAPSITVGSGEGVAVPAGSTLTLRSRSTPTTVMT